jgi:hypothetical protein
MTDCCSALIVDMPRLSPLFSILVQSVRFFVELGLAGNERVQNREPFLLLRFDEIIAEWEEIY